MRLHLIEEAKARDDAVVEVDQLGLGQPVDVDLHQDSAAQAQSLASGFLRNKRGGNSGESFRRNTLFSPEIFAG